jgi:protein tyrosine/serine phosphatase
MDELMGRTCSYFYPRKSNHNYPNQEAQEQKALFGGYPTQEQVNLLESIGVKWFVDLTLGNEKRTIPYTVTDKDKYITYPILDQFAPSDIIGFVKFINKLITIICKLSENEKIYIHCKGGHGRSGLVAATLLCAMDEIYPENAIAETTISHNKRYMMKKKWKKIGSPQTRYQCDFLHSLFESQNIDNHPLLSLSSIHTVAISFFETTETVKVFQTAYDAICYLTNITQKPEKNQSCSFKTNDYKNNVKYLTDECVQKFRECVEFVLDLKFQQHSDCKKCLLETGFRQLKCRFQNSHSCIGTICIKLRNKYYSTD